MSEFVPITERAKGRWSSLLPEFGIGKEFLTGRHGPCPLCGGKDRWRFDDKGTGRYICAQCGAGSGMDLVMKVNNWDFKRAAKEVAKYVDDARVSPVRLGPNPADVRSECNRLWKSSVSIGAVDEVSDWWKTRVGCVPMVADIRALPALRCPGAGVHAAMLAKVRDKDGKPVNIHRTWLAPGGSKALVDEPRRVMPLPMPKGSAVRLFAPREVLGIAEGLETAVAASLLFGVPVWSALNAVNLEVWEPPEGVGVIVFADNDHNFRGQRAAYALANRLSGKNIEVSVELPPAPGMDFNDMWSARMESREDAA
jgi:putative DNA primase/helicase